MASTLLLASFAVFLTLTLTLPSPSTSTEVSRLDVLGWVCNNGSVPDQEAYRRSYQINIDKTRDDMRKLKFGTHEDGVPPQKMYFLSQCVSDLSPDECSLCWSRATDLLFNCFPSPGGRFYLDGCFVRADNYSFYREPVTRQDSKICGGDESSSSREFKGLVKEVTKSIVDTAPYSQGFSVVARKSVHGLTAYGLGICRQTLDEELCQLCLADGALSATSCSPATEAFVMNAGCYLRYSNYTFYNERELLSMSLTKEHVLRILVISMVCVLAIASGFWCGKCIYLGASSKKKLKEKESKSVSNNSNLMCFKYSTLEKATNNFNESCKLGVGGYGEVFKGTLSDGREIAIKRLHISGNKTREEIHNEIDVISRCQHKNLVRLIGCCFTNMNSFIIYEFLANSSLDHILFNPEKKKELEWKKRRAIILGTAEGLEYLHEACKIIHRDIKASNILLDLKYKPKISDFGLAKFYPEGGKDIPSSSPSPSPSPIAGTLGYMAPEYISKGILSNKIDAYSFGVLVLEITSGFRNNKFRSDNSLETLVTQVSLFILSDQSLTQYSYTHFSNNFVEQVWKCYASDKMEEMIDKDMEEETDKTEVKRVMQIGLLCTQESPQLRPTMSKVIEMINSTDLVLPTPTKPPFLHDSM
ncbi:putative cysteine-rich receptor-like protein kinase 43 isoform X1 [Brassica rapa]|uniref:putative cysteine-rich receptor-like protein kinase 43 isoform X1 n=1 Tax=Brassica campestris TaxID=3711 RepID=UPI00142E8457|nr:putative cysteine-rich receptor-like protein kinase 43 isoform X1 [Brassica rapa]